MTENTTIENRTKPDSHNQEMVSDDTKLKIREILDKILENPKPDPRWKRFLTHPLILLFVGSFLTLVVGSYISYYYNSKQAEIQHQHDDRQAEIQREHDDRQAEIQRRRSIADEFNKIKVFKIAEVWERIYPYEMAVNETIQNITLIRAGEVYIPKSYNLLEAIQENEKMKKELLYLLAKNKFWLEDENYEALMRYVAETYDALYAAQKGDKDSEDKRKKASETLAKVKEKMFKEISNASSN